MTSNLRAETINFDSYDDHSVEAYLATTEGEKVGGVVVIHHFPGYDEATKEIARKFAANGYNAICVNLYSRESPGATSVPPRPTCAPCPTRIKRWVSSATAPVDDSRCSRRAVWTSMPRSTVTGPSWS